MKRSRTVIQYPCGRYDGGSQLVTDINDARVYNNLAGAKNSAAKYGSTTGLTFVPVVIQLKDTP